jgi:hypothetical protein
VAVNRDGVKVSTRTIDGRKYDVFCRRDGTFVVTLDDDDELEASTLDQLVKKLAEEARRSKRRLAIKATRVEKHGYDDHTITLHDAIITGVNRRTRRILYRDANGKAGQGWRFGGDFVRPLDAREKTQYIALVSAVHTAQKNLEKFEKLIEFDVEEAIEAALKE